MWELTWIVRALARAGTATFGTPVLLLDQLPFVAPCVPLRRQLAHAAVLVIMGMTPRGFSAGVVLRLKLTVMVICIGETADRSSSKPINNRPLDSLSMRDNGLAELAKAQPGGLNPRISMPNAAQVSEWPTPLFGRRVWLWESARTS
jgi:hypothetical protein